ncbi:MAG: hypothetical protein ACRDPQ_11880 [Nocardioidaceae bacterium]
MTDINELLRETARSAEATPPPDVVEADVLRGRAGLLRRRRRRAVWSSVAGTVVVAAMVAVTVVVGQPENGSGVATPDGASSPSEATGVRLVTYTGEQLDGFVVDRVPEGWFLQGSTPYALTIAPDGDTTHPAAFTGKLVVMLYSQHMSEQLPDGGEPIEIGGTDGVVTRDGSGDAHLYYIDGEGHYAEVQAPSALGWTNQELASFADGVTVTVNAQQGLG